MNKKMRPSLTRFTLMKIQAFTLMELLVTITIIGILAAIAIPSYLTYTRRAHYSEIVQATANYKNGVASCYTQLGTLTGCNAGANGIPSAITAATGSVATLSVLNGIITVTPVVQNGLVAGDTYILTPAIAGETLIWAASGGGVTKGYTR